MNITNIINNCTRLTPILMKIELTFEYIIHRLQLKIHIKIVCSLAIMNDFINQTFLPKNSIQCQGFPKYK